MLNNLSTPSLIVMLTLPLSTLAETVLSVDDTTQQQTDVTTANKTDVARPVETGTGGNIKLERKYRSRAESQFEWHAHLLWESRYVTEGRDNLAGDSLTSTSTEFIVDKWSFIPWLAYSPAADYTELNMNIIYGTKITEKIELYAGYNHIESRQNNLTDSDNEVSLDLAFRLAKRLNLLTSFYHSFEIAGSFWEIAIKQGIPINDALKFSLRGVLGINSGYISDGHTGLNHFQLTANIAYVPLKQLEIYAYSGYNRALDRDTQSYAGDQLLDDFVWAGLGFSYLF